MDGSDLPCYILWPARTAEQSFWCIDAWKGDCITGPTPSIEGWLKVNLKPPLKPPLKVLALDLKA